MISVPNKPFLWLTMIGVVAGLTMALSAHQVISDQSEPVNNLLKIASAYEHFISTNGSLSHAPPNRPQEQLSSLYIANGTLAEQQAALTMIVSQLALQTQLQVLSSNQVVTQEVSPTFISVSIDLMGTWPALVSMIARVAHSNPPLIVNSLEFRGRVGALDDGRSEVPLSLTLKLSALANPGDSTDVAPP